MAPALCMPAAAERSVRSTPVRSTLNMSFHCSSESSLTADRRRIPAHATATSSCPYRCIASLTRSST